MADINIQDESGDKEYFTIIPNYIANHSTANDQALYLQMKRFAGEEGRCFATEETLMKKLGIGRQKYHKSLNYLLEKGWISYIGMTEGRTRPIKTYRVNNIWKMNNEHYKKIPSETTVSKDSAILDRDTVQNSSKIPSRTAVEEEPVLRRTNNNICLFEKFWKEYPKKENKKKTQEIWIRKKLDSSYEQIISFIKKAKGTERWQKGFIPHATTFLNGERWNDDISSYGEGENEDVIVPEYAKEYGK
jgi:hypothetical protein